MKIDMAIMQKETVWADEQSLSHAPARILEIELEHPLPTISSFDEKKERYYRRAYCLVRLHTQPLGLVMLNFDKDELRPDEYALQVWQALHERINEHLRQDGLPSVMALDEHGLPAASMSLCKAEREQFLAHAPFASVIISTHDRPEQVMRCLNSLISLRYPHYEIIVVDNAPSTDAIDILVQDLSQRISFIRYVREDCPGLSWARNRGIMAAKGEILAFTDDDVIVDPYWLADLAR